MKDIENRIFHVTNEHFDSLALEVFLLQYRLNPLYQSYVNALHTDVNSVRSLTQIPFLPVGFFKTHEVKTTAFHEAVVFESSGTTQSLNSKHYVKNISLYTKSFTRGFEKFYGHAGDWCILGLLPSYLERKNSSLVMMVDELIRLSNHPQSGFYLYEHEKLNAVLAALELKGTRTLLIGVTFALLDFAEKYPRPLKHTIVMETGGMKGRRKELTRQETHEFLMNQFGLTAVHSEYGMTELLSQAYSKGQGRFEPVPWMKVLLRNEDDPFDVTTKGSGIVNLIDLANIYSCSFIATDDVGTVFEDGSFEISGRRDNSDIRGCSLLVT